MSAISDTCYDWGELLCGKVEEMLTADATEPLEKHVVTISYHDTDLCHNVIAS